MNICTRLSLLATLLAASNAAHATIVQYLWGNTYENPAALNMTKDGVFTLGVIWAAPSSNFSGMTQNGPANASASSSAGLPYFSLAKRLSPDLVVGLDCSRPFYGDLDYGINSSVAGFSTRTTLNSVDLSPKVSWQVTPQLALGAGFSATQLYGININFALAPGQEVTNQGSGWAYGFNLGASYALNQTNFLALSVFSGSNITFKGPSTYQGNSNPLTITGVGLPTTVIASWTHMFSMRAGMAVKAVYAGWGTTEAISLSNMGGLGPAVFPTKFKNTGTLNIVGFDHFNSGYGVVGGLQLDSTGVDTANRSLPFPTAPATTVYAGVNKSFSRNLEGQIVGVRSFVNTSIDEQGPYGTFLSGAFTIRATAVDAKLTWKF